MRPVVSALTVLAVLALASAAHAAPGDLDETFSDDGLAVFGAPDAVFDLAVTSGGAIIVAENTAPRAVISRYTESGELDRAFAGDGVQPDALGSTESAVRAIALRDTGRIVIGGRTGLPYTNDFAVTELGPDGAPVCGGGGSCIVTTDFAGGTDRLTDVVVDPSGGILAAGIVAEGGGDRLGVARYLPSGALDGSFSGDGKFVLHSGGVSTDADRAVVAALPDGSILLAGAGPGPDGAGRGDLLLAKLEPDGDLDPGFGGGDGWVTLDLAGRDDAASIAIAPDGAVIVGIDACAFGLTTDCEAAIARFRPTGELDPGFGSGGVVMPAAGSRIALGADGRLYAAGTTPPREFFLSDFAVARYAADGAPDPTFSTDGVATADFGLRHDFVGAFGLAGDGRPVLAGYAGGGEVTRLGLARFEVAGGPADADADGVLDEADRCPERFEAKRDGCPRISRELTMKAVSGGGLKVTLQADLDLCVARQRVSITRGDETIARPRTSRRGVWRSDHRLPDGRYGALVEAKPASGLGRCAGARARIELPRRRQQA